jgi:hypothetical protein
MVPLPFGCWGQRAGAVKWKNERYYEWPLLFWLVKSFGKQSARQIPAMSTSCTFCNQALGASQKRIGAAAFLLSFALGTTTALKGAEAIPQATNNRPNGSQELAGADILRESLDFYKRLRTFSSIVEVELRMQEEGFTMTGRDHYSMDIQRPNRLALVLKGETERGRLICDGYHVYTYCCLSNRYSTVQAPGTLGQIKGGAFGKLGHAPSLLNYIKILFDDQDDGLFRKEASTATYIGAEDVEGIPCGRVHFVGSGGTFDIWVEIGRRPLIHKLVFSPSAEAAKRSPRYREDLKDTTMQAIICFRDCKLNLEFPKDRFKFTPLPGAQATAPL